MPEILKAATLVSIATTSPENMDDKATYVFEAEKLITFDDAVLNNRQKTFIDKL